MKQRTVIEAGDNGLGYWKDLWAYRGLFRFLAWRDLLVRYKQTVIGVAWAVIRPLLTIVVFSFFAELMDMETFALPAVLVVTAATLPMQLFTSALNEASNSLISNSGLITKVFFPRLIIPLSTIIVCLVDFAITLVILIGLMFYYNVVPDSNIIYLPLFLLLLLMASLGAGVFLSAVNVKYRDFRYIIPFIVQVALYVSPIAFKTERILASERIPDFLKWLYSFNPMVAVIDGFRWSLFGEQFKIDQTSIFISICVTVFLVVAGTWYFRKVEKNFADII
ncbi:MAG TPA: ABC transporter permease [Bacteroidia bacterium]|nr:ABC transporter permease [Bacteroidia bacterium]